MHRKKISVARKQDMIGTALIAGDSTKLRAQNSKKNSYNHKKFGRLLDHIDRKLREYNEARVNGMIFQSSEVTPCIEENGGQISSRETSYKKSQALVEHPFGTIKLQWDFDHRFTKRGLEAASGDLALIAPTHLKSIIHSFKSRLLRPYLG